MATPNPLPCGCRVVEVTDETTEHFRTFHFAVEHCLLHAAAPDLLAALKECLLVLQVNRLHEWVGGKMARAAIAKAEQPTTRGE